MVVKRVTKSDYEPFLLQRHYAKRVPTVCHAFGLYDGEILLGVVCYGIPASRFVQVGVCDGRNPNSVLELNRLALNSDAPKNAASMLVGRSLKMIPKGSVVVSYADCGVGHVGYVYQATNWIYTGCTKARTDIRGIGGKHPRHYAGGELDRVERTAKHRYVYFTDRRDMKYLKWDIESYPKGETKKTDGQDVFTQTPQVAFDFGDTETRLIG